MGLPKSRNARSEQGVYHFYMDYSLDDPLEFVFRCRDYQLRVSKPELVTQFFVNAKTCSLTLFSQKIS